jgi:hypothetical protein
MTQAGEHLPYEHEALSSNSSLTKKKQKKNSQHQEEVTIINMYAPNNRAPKYMKQKLTEKKREINNSK